MKKSILTGVMAAIGLGAALSQPAMDFWPHTARPLVKKYSSKRKNKRKNAAKKRWSENSQRLRIAEAKRWSNPMLVGAAARQRAA